MTAPSQPVLPSSLVLVGAGKMGGAMLEGWLAVGLKPHAISVFDPHPGQDIQNLCGAHHIALNPRLKDTPAPSVLVIAVKPQAFTAVTPLLDRLIEPQTLTLSIMAGKTLANIKDHIPVARAIVRAMPNLPASVRRGATVAIADKGVHAHQKAMADGLLKSVGIVEWLQDESLMDAATALSGSGPAYIFYLAECLAHAGISAGLPAALSEHLARATVIGSAHLLHKNDLPPAKLRQAVTSPGGTTAAALHVLMQDGGLDHIMREAVLAAKQRSEELSG
jgi:pyrroline-5-carboxylate reductase